MGSQVGGQLTGGSDDGWLTAPASEADVGNTYSEQKN